MPPLPFLQKHHNKETMTKSKGKERFQGAPYRQNERRRCCDSVMAVFARWGSTQDGCVGSGGKEEASSSCEEKVRVSSQYPIQGDHFCERNQQQNEKGIGSIKNSGSEDDELESLYDEITLSESLYDEITVTDSVYEEIILDSENESCEEMSIYSEHTIDEDDNDEFCDQMGLYSEHTLEEAKFEEAAFEATLATIDEHEDEDSHETSSCSNSRSDDHDTESLHEDNLKDTMDETKHEAPASCYREEDGSDSDNESVIYRAVEYLLAKHANLIMLAKRTTTSTYEGVTFRKKLARDTSLAKESELGEWLEGVKGKGNAGTKLRKKKKKKKKKDDSKKKKKKKKRDKMKKQMNGKKSSSKLGSLSIGASTSQLGIFQSEEEKSSESTLDTFLGDSFGSLTSKSYSEESNENAITS